MQNQHVTPFPNGAEHPLYTGVAQETGNGAYPIEPLEDTWTSHQPEPHQYAHQGFPVAQQYYNPYVEQQQQSQQQPVFQGYSNLAQSAPYTSYQPQATQFADPFFTAPSAQHDFTNGYNFSTQPSQHETISPQALQVEDSVPQNDFHQRQLGQQQVFDRNVPQDGWAQEQAVVNSSAQFPSLLNGNAIPKSTASAITTQQANRSNLDYLSYMNSVPNRASAASTYGYDSGTGQPLRGGSLSSVSPRNPNPPAPRPSPPRVTHGDLLARYPSETDVAHRIKNLPFALLPGTVTPLDIRGKSLSPVPYQNSM